MIIVVAPGQGSQTPGFLEPWLDVAGVRDHLESLSDAAGVDLIAHGTTSDADTIRATEIAQPLIVAASIVTGKVLIDNRQDSVAAVAGHSVGEFAAAHLAGILSDVDAVKLVGVRGRAMAAEAAKAPSGMSAVLGGDSAELDIALAHHGLFAANMNGGGQVVIAGSLDALAAFAAEPIAGCRVIPLQVAGAFHTQFMAGAVETLREPRRLSPHRTRRFRFTRTATARGSLPGPPIVSSSWGKSVTPYVGTSVWSHSPRTV